MEVELTDEQQHELKEKYPSVTSENRINWDDLKAALETVGVSLAGHELRELVGTQPKPFSMEEFRKVYSKGKQLKAIGQALKMPLLKTNVDVKPFREVEDSDVKHSISHSEERGFSLWINRHLEKDPDLASTYLPIDPEVDGQLYTKCTDGVLICKMINISSPNTIDERSINKGATLKRVFNVNENLTLAVNSAAAIGVCVVNIGPRDIADKKKHILLGLIWQLIRKALVDTITLNQHTELIALLYDGETAEDLMNLKPEELLLRWVNYHLEKSNTPRRISNFNKDISDSEIYSNLIERIAPSDKKSQLKKAAAILSSCDVKCRAADVLTNAEVLGAHGFLTAEDIYQADTKDKESRHRLNLAFLATLFNMYPCLDPVEDHPVIESETLEEKTYRNWMNSMGVNPYVSYLAADLSDGIVLLQLIDIIEPGTVDWSKVTLKFDPKKVLFQKQENCNLVITYGSTINIRFVNVDGGDIRQRNKKLVLAVCFQLMYAYMYKQIHQAIGDGTGTPRQEQDALEWANEQLKCANVKPLTGFRDPLFSTGVPILQILEQIRPGSTNKEVWQSGSSDNFSICTYAISSSRKAGACVYALPEHLSDKNGKMIQTVLISLQALHYSLQRVGKA